MVISTTLWLVCAHTLTASLVGLAVWAVIVRDYADQSFSLLGACALLLVLRFRFRSAGARARLLSGHSPFGCCNAPSTPKALVEQLCAVWIATKSRPSVVGSGWGWFIGRAQAPNAVFTHRLRGRANQQLNFFAGTELCTVEAEIRRTHGCTFYSTPTMQRISIGSWLARSCHGNRGPAGKPSSCACVFVTVVNISSLETTREGYYEVEYSEIKPMIDESPEDYVIVAAEFDVKLMSKNVWLQKSRVDVVPDTNMPTLDLREWLTPLAVLRVLFFGSARSCAIGVFYVPFKEDRDTPHLRHQCGCCGKLIPHIDPHDCSAACMSMQLDTCSLVCGWHERSKKAWRGIIRLSDANAFSPDPSWLVFPTISLLSCTVNFELIFVLQRLNLVKLQREDEMRVQRLCNTLLNLYKHVWGRAEMRMGGLDQGLVFIDCITRECDADAIVQKLAPHMHSNFVALHNSKFVGHSVKDAISNAGVVLKTPGFIFDMSKKSAMRSEGTTSN
jgi:ribosomal protein L37AE/L43A